jgi:hypothetical protein
MEAEQGSSALAVRTQRRRGVDAAVCAALFLISLLAYLRTMRPTFGWGDSSELITAAYYLGVGHSPGYPTWLLLAYPFSHLPFGDVAFRVNFMTVLVGAVGVALLYLLYSKISGSRPAAVIAALTFALSATFWDQTTEAEVYTLHVCLAATILLILLAWRSTGVDRRLYLLAWVIGISLGNHALTALMIPAILYFVWAEKGLRFFTRRRLLTCAGFFVLGLSIYVYEPIRALDNPPPHINNPHNLIEMWAQLTAPGARQAMFDRGMLVPLQRVVMHLYRLGFEFQYAGCALALFGLGLLWRRDRHLTGLLALIAFFDIAYSVNFSIFDIYVYFLPLHLVWAALIAVGVKGASDLVARLMARVPERVMSPKPVWRYGPAVAVLMALPMVQFTQHVNLVDGSQDYGSERFARAVVKQVEPGSLILADWWSIAPIGYLKYIEGQRKDLVMFAAPSIYAESGFLDFAKEDFLRKFPAVYFVEMLTYRMQLLRSKCYLVPQGPVYRVYVERPAPEAVLVDMPAAPIARFGDRVGLVKAELRQRTVTPGECFGFTLYWTPLDGYNARNHEAILVLENKKDGRIWQESNLLAHNLYPLDKWRKGEVLREEHRIYLPDPEPKGEYNLYVRVREHGQSKCLLCHAHEKGGHDRDYLIARLQVGDPTPMSERGRVPTVMAFLRP